MNEWQNTELSFRLALAGAEDTPSEVLQELAKDSALEVRKAVAGNPNAPTGTLLELGKEFPDEITANPIFVIQMLAEPGSRFIRLSLARSSTTSEDTLAKLSDLPNYEIVGAVASNTATPVSILEKLARHSPAFEDWDDEYHHSSDFVCCQIAANDGINAGLLG